MASDLLNMGAQSVLTAQKQLNTTGHNISNVNTEGYSRQSVIQGVNTPRQYGGESYGMGVHVENVRRSWDQFAVNELNLSTTRFAKSQDVEANYDLLSGMLSSTTATKLPDNVNDWFDAVKSLADSPNDDGLRKVVLEKAKAVTQNLNDFHETVRQQAVNTNKKLDVAVKRVNQLAIEIRDLHRLMMKTPGPHNDLMDKHDKLIKELSEYTKVTVTPRKNAEGFNVHIGNGHTLVSGTEASQLTMIDGDPDVHQHRLAMIEGKSVKAITTKDIDGKIGALLQMRDEQIPYIQDEVGRMSASLALKVNQLQSQGMDLNGHVGRNLFTDVNSEAIAKSRVIQRADSNADLAVFIDDPSQLKGGEYTLQFSGGRYLLTNPQGEQQVAALNGNSIQVDGLRIDIRQGLATGEKVMIRPTREMAGQIKTVMDDPALIAAQSYEASTTFANGHAQFGIDTIGGLREFAVVISPDGQQFTVTDPNGKALTEAQPYPPKAPVSVMGTTFHLSGGALPNDKFTANLVPSEGDNGNLLKMLDVQTDKTLNNHESTVLDIYQNLNTDIGVQAATASRLTDVARLENESAQERVASISGVNLDEEAANMMKFQQAYMASSRIMQTANDTFNTILALR